MDLYVVGPDQDLDIEMVNSTLTDPVPIGEGVTVTWEVPMFKAEGIPKTIDIAIQLLEAVPVGVAANIITNWLMARFKGRAERVVIEHQEVEFDEGKLKRIVHETITREHGK